MATTVTSTQVEYRIAELNSDFELPASPVFLPITADTGTASFTVDVTTQGRETSTATRQRGKGDVVDFESTGSYDSAVTSVGFMERLQGFLYADVRETVKTMPINGTDIPITSVSATQYLADSGLDAFNAGDLILADNFTNAGNNGLKNITASASGTLTASGLVAEASPPSDAQITQVGFQFASADATITTPSDDLPRLNATAKDLTELDLVVGQWVVIGGDATNNQFNTDGANFIGRVNTITADYISFDKSDINVSADTGTGKTIRIFFGDVIKNENDTDLITIRKYEVEKRLGEDSDGDLSQYLNEMQGTTLTLSIPTTGFLTASYGFSGTTSEERTGSEGLKTGTRPAETDEAPFSSVNGVVDASLQPADGSLTNPDAYFTYITELSIEIDNNVGRQNAIGTRGAIATPEGTFSVSGSLTCALQNNLEYLTAISEGADVTAHVIWATANNVGLVFDLPLITLGGGGETIGEGEIVSIPLTYEASASGEGDDRHTFMVNSWHYTPDRVAP